MNVRHLVLLALLLCTLRATGDDAPDWSSSEVKLAFEELEERVAWNTKLGEPISGLILRVEEHRVLFSLLGKDQWFPIYVLGESEQDAIHDFQALVKRHHDLSIPAFGARIIGSAEAIDNRNLVDRGEQHQVEVFSDIKGKTVTARITSANWFAIHLEMPTGRTMVLPVWAISQIDRERLIKSYGDQRFRAFPSPVDETVASSQQRLSKQEWRMQFGKRIRRAKSSPDAIEESAEWIRNIVDPSAVDSLSKLASDDDASLTLRLSAMDALVRMKDDDAIATLVELATVSPDANIRSAAKTALQFRDDKATVLHAFNDLLERRQIRSIAIRVINELSLLDSFEEPHYETKRDPDFIKTLVNGLIEKDHYTKVVPTFYTYRWSHSSPGNGKIPGSHERGFRGIGGTKSIPYRLETRQPEVYETLKKYTGKDFGYNQTAWRSWAKGGS